MAGCAGDRCSRTSMSLNSSLQVQKGRPFLVQSRTANSVRKHATRLRYTNQQSVKEELDRYSRTYSI